VNRLKDLRNILENAVTEYNKYHSPEVKAKLVSLNEKTFIIEFKGSFCQTCGFYDYFDDYKILLGEQGLNASIAEIMEIDEGAVVTLEGVENT
jgi:hypothetical protein